MSAYTEAVERQLEGVEYFSVGPCPGCLDCFGLLGVSAVDPENPTDSESDMASEGSFSWWACEGCGSTFGGTRSPAHGFIDGKLHHFRVCTDCLVYHANGEEPEGWYRTPAEQREDELPKCFWCDATDHTSEECPEMDDEFEDT